MVGSAWGTVEIKNCKNYANIYGCELVGGIIGQLSTENGIIEGCINYGNLTYEWGAVGGITGENSSDAGYIKNCENYGNIQNIKLDDVGGVTDIGGISGHNSTVVENCNNYGNINIVTDVKSCNVGGISSEIYRSKDGIEKQIVNCSNYGNIIAENSTEVGGICGLGTSSKFGTFVENCYNTGNTKGKSNVGGIIGSNGVGDGSVGKDIECENVVINCYNSGNIEGNENVGGIAGKNGTYIVEEWYGKIYKYNIKGNVQNCYNIGTIQGTTKVGALVGVNSSKSESTIQNSYYLLGTANLAYTTDEDEEIVGGSKTETEMKSEEFIALLNNGGSDWVKDTLNKNKGYPILSFMK